MATKEQVNEVQVSIPAPEFEIMEFPIHGDILVAHRFSQKAKNELAQKQAGLSPKGSRKVRVAQSPEDVYNAARYIHKEGWDGCPASAIRKAMVRACSLVGFQMTLARMSIFVIQDGWDKVEPQTPLVRIYGEPVLQSDMARVSGGAPYITYRPAYHDWKMRPRLRWDRKQFSVSDVSNLLRIAGEQVGLLEGRPSSPSGGMGWGLFELDGVSSSASNGKRKRIAA